MIQTFTGLLLIFYGSCAQEFDKFSVGDEVRATSWRGRNQIGKILSIGEEYVYSNNRKIELVSKKWKSLRLLNS